MVQHICCQPDPVLVAYVKYDGRCTVELKVLPYTTKDGEQPIISFLQGLNMKQPELAKALEAGIRKLGNRAYLGFPLAEKVDDEDTIFEVCVGRKDIARGFFFRAGQTIVVTNGYVTTGQNVDRGELERAKTYKRDWEERYP
jgi:hypothetical protein